jgi:tetratricopeptide (TPR) repeat protein
MIFLKRFKKKKADKLLQKGVVSEAIELYRKGKAWDRLVAAYESLGDFASAANAAKEAGLYESAARLYEKTASHKQAAEMWLKVSQPEKAAADLENAKDYEGAAGLYRRLQMPSKAASALAAAGSFGEAGSLYEEAGDAENAAEMYRAANQLEKVGRMLEEAGNLESAAEAYHEAGEERKAAELFAKLDRAYDSARCYVGLGDYQKAGDQFIACGHLFEAAEAYSKDEKTADKAALIFTRALCSEPSWEKELEGPITCLGVSPSGAFIAVGAARKLRVFNEGGELLWRFTPTWGGLPSCLVVRDNGTVVMGCEDKHLYCLDSNKTILWDYELKGAPIKLAADAAGECIVCCLEGNIALCLDKEGNRRWDYTADCIVWDADVSPDGKVVALAMADGSCRIATSANKVVGEYKASAWAHSVSVRDNGTFALGYGMDGVELIDGRSFVPVWSRQDPSSVHNVVLTRDNFVLSVGDDEALLRDESGTIIWRFARDIRLLGGRLDGERRMVVLRAAKKKLLRIDMRHCKSEAAACFAKAKDFPKAGRLYEEIQDHNNACKMFYSASDYTGAARNAETAGNIEEAAELYEKAEDFGRAAKLYESIGKLGKSADFYTRAGQPVKAGELLEQSGDLAGAAKLFEQGKAYGRAGESYEKTDDKPEAIRVFKTHVSEKPDDHEKRFRLGLLLQAEGLYDEAIEQFQRTATVDELRRKSSLHVAECFLGKEMYDIAIERFEACLETGERASHRNLEVYYGLAKAYHLAGNYREAKHTYESILAVDFRYRDVTQRLEDVHRLSKVFSAQQGSAVVEDDGRTMVASDAFQRFSAEKKERYVPIRRLGEGGMGTVYLAEDRRLNRQVALKMLTGSLRSNEKMRLRMIREAQLAAQVVHPNVVSVFDVGEEQGCCYVSMEYVEGQTLRDLLEANGPLDPAECVQVLLQVTQGLGYAHNKGLAHRDIKPENIMVTEDGTAKIMDFGLAMAVGATRMTEPGAICGTPLYMAPEQLRGDEDLGHAVDTYAMGCMAYELLTGKPPFSEGNIAAQHLNKAPTPLREARAEVPEALEQVIMKCLEKDPADRYPDGSSLHAALKEIDKTM